MRNLSVPSIPRPDVARCQKDGNRPRSVSTISLPDTRCCMCPGRRAIPNLAVALGLPHDSLATRRRSVIV